MKTITNFIKTITFFIFLAFCPSHAQDCSGVISDPNILSDFECQENFTYPSSLTKISNVSVTGINVSDNIGKYVDDGNNGWDALIIDYGAAIDLSVNNILRFKFYSATSVQVLAKIEGGTAVEVWSNFSGINTWQEFTYDFSGAIANGNTKLVLFFNAAQTTGNTEDVYYFDDLEWIDSTVLSIENQLDSKLSIYPNPVKDNLKVLNAAQNKIESIKIFDVSGKVVCVAQDNDVIDVSSLSSGVYYIQVSSSEGSVTKKFIKK